MITLTGQFEYLIRHFIIRSCEVWSRKIYSLNNNTCITLKFGRCLGSSAAEIAVKLQSDQIILNAISRLRKFARSRDIIILMAQSISVVSPYANALEILRSSAKPVI